MRIDLNRVSTLDFLIRHRSTGCPDSLAKRLNISKRTLHFTLGHLKDIFNAPIKYDRNRKTYFFAEDGYVIISFQRTRSSSGIQLMLEMDVTADMLPA